MRKCRKEQVILFSMKNSAADIKRHSDSTTEHKERIPLNNFTVKVIKGTRYKVRSIYVGDKDFRQLYEDIIAAKAARQQNSCCNDMQDAV